MIIAGYRAREDNYFEVLDLLSSDIISEHDDEDGAIISKHGDELEDDDFILPKRARRYGRNSFSIVLYSLQLELHRLFHDETLLVFVKEVAIELEGFHFGHERFPFMRLDAKHLHAFHILWGLICEITRQ